MKRSFLILVVERVSVHLLLVIFVASLGCKSGPLRDPRFQDPSAYPVVEGKWVGRVRLAQVYGNFRPGQNSTAIELEIVKGPAFPEGEPCFNATLPGGGRVPLLAHNTSVGATLLPVTSLPLGKLVEVSGTMGITVVNATSDGPLVSRLVVPGSLYPPDHVLIVSGNPRVLE